MQRNELPISLATGGYEHVINIWSPSDGRLMRTLQHMESQVNSLVFSLDRRTLAASGYGKVRLYDVNNLNSTAPIATLSEFDKNVNSIGFNENCSCLFAGGEDRSVKIIDRRTIGNGAACITRNLLCGGPVNSIVLHPKQEELLVATERGEIHIWDFRNEKAPLTTLIPGPLGDAVYSIALNSEGTCLAAVNALGELIAWNYAKDISFMKTLHRSTVHKSYGLKVLFSPDGTLLVTCGADTKFNVINTADFAVNFAKQDEKAHYWYWDCAFSADSRYLLTASSDALARLWNLETGQEILNYVGHKKPVTCMAFRDQTFEEQC